MSSGSLLPPTIPAVLQAAFETCSENLALHDRDRWLAALFVPQDKRPYIHALYAFSHEIARLREIVSEPQLGEIRLQWWRESLEGERAGEAMQNPVSAALLETLRACKLPAAPLLKLIEARRFDLYNDPMPDMQTLEGYCGETVSALFQLAALVLCSSPGNALNESDVRILADASGHAGVAYGLAGLMRALPWHAARGQCYLPGDVLARHGALVETFANGLLTQPGLAALAHMRTWAADHESKARAALAKLPAVVWPAFVPLAVVPLYLRRMEKLRDPFRESVEVAAWRRQWAMWRFRGGK